MKILKRLSKTYRRINLVLRSKALLGSSPLTYGFMLMPIRAGLRLIRPDTRLRMGKLSFYSTRTSMWIVYQVVLFDEYEIIDFLLKGKKRPTVVDLGANIGMFALRVLKSFPAASIQCFEANPATYQLLVRNHRANPGSDWQVHHAAGWRTDGVVRFSSQDAGNPMGMVLEEGEVVVPSLSLETLLSEYVETPIDLLKIDIEGGEEALICGTHDQLKSVESLIIQVHHDLCNSQEVIAAIRKEYGYLYEIVGRKSRNPLFLACRREHDLPMLEPYSDC